MAANHPLTLAYLASTLSLSLLSMHVLRHSAPLILRPAASLTDSTFKSRKRLKDRTWAVPPLAWQTQSCASLTRLQSRKQKKAWEP